MFLTQQEIAAKLGVSRATVAVYLDKGILPSVVIHGRRRVPSEALQEWIRQQNEKAQEAVRG